MRERVDWHLCSVEVLEGEVPQLTGCVQKEELEPSGGDAGRLPWVTEEQQHSNIDIYFFYIYVY